MRNDRDTFKRFLTIYLIVYTLACVVFHQFLAEAFGGAPGDTWFYCAFRGVINLVIILGVPSVLLAGVIFAVLPEKWGGDG